MKDIGICLDFWVSLNFLYKTLCSISIILFDLLLFVKEKEKTIMWEPGTKDFPPLVGLWSSHGHNRPPAVANNFRLQRRGNRLKMNVLPREAMRFVTGRSRCWPLCTTTFRPLWWIQLPFYLQRTPLLLHGGWICLPVSNTDMMSGSAIVHFACAQRIKECQALRTLSSL